MRTSIKLTSVAVVLAAATVFTSLVRAGEKSTDAVAVRFAATAAWGSGSMDSARYSTDTKEYIGCETDAYVGFTTTVSCTAVSATNQAFTCSSDDPTLVAAVGRINESSDIEFAANVGPMGDYVCANIIIRNGSNWVH